MRVNEIFNNSVIPELGVIKSKCSQFLSEAGDFPLIKQLPQTYMDLQKVKVRKRKKKHSNKFTNTFNVAFKDQINNLRERAIFANSAEVNTGLVESFYIFPVDGYKYLFSKEVKNSTKCYNAVFESILDQLGDEQPSEDIFTELLKFNYVSEDLTDGIEAGAEIIIHSIPYYYALRESTVDAYTNLLTRLP